MNQKFSRMEIEVHEFTQLFDKAVGSHEWLTGYPNAGKITPMAGHVWSDSKELIAGPDLNQDVANFIAACPAMIRKLLIAWSNNKCSCQKETPNEKAIRFGVDFAMPGADKTVAVYEDEFSNLSPVEYGRLEARVLAAIAKGQPPVLLRRGFFKKGKDDEKK